MRRTLAASPLALVLSLALVMSVALAGCGGRTSDGAATASPTAQSPLAHTTIYTTTILPVGPVDGSRGIVGFDAATGAQERTVYAAGTMYLTSSPAVANGALYAGGYHTPDVCNGPGPCPPLQYAVYALDQQSGAVRWQAPVDGPVNGPPSVVAAVVYAATSAPGRSVYALDAATGALRWRFQTAIGMFAPTVVDGVVYVSGDAVYALRADTGAALWHAGQYAGTELAAPVIAGGAVYVANGGGKVTALRASDGSVLWNDLTGASFSSAPAVAGGVVYIGPDHVATRGAAAYAYAFDATTGATRWHAQVSGVSGGGAPAVSDGVVYFGLTGSVLAALDAATGTPRWTFKATSYVDFDSQYVQTAEQLGLAEGPVVRGDTLYFVADCACGDDPRQSPSALYALDAHDGTVRWVTASTPILMRLGTPLVFTP